MKPDCSSVLLTVLDPNAAAVAQLAQVADSHEVPGLEAGGDDLARVGLSAQAYGATFHRIAVNDENDVGGAARGDRVRGNDDAGRHGLFIPGSRGLGVAQEC